LSDRQLALQSVEAVEQRHLLLFGLTDVLLQQFDFVGEAGIGGFDLGRIVTKN
jgi:hypothetical protein